MSCRPKAPPPRFAIHRPETILRAVVRQPAPDPPKIPGLTAEVKARLLEGDPDWTEFKRRWAAEFGEP